VTSDIVRRIDQHRSGMIDGFTRRPGVKRLIYVEMCGDMTTAIAREKQRRCGLRAWKIALMEEVNPGWRDVAIDLGFAPYRPRSTESASRLDPETSSE
jgi:putative endonuclease